MDEFLLPDDRTHNSNLEGVQVNDVALDREMGYTQWEFSCRTPHPDLEDVLCRRLHDHVDDHASGFGEHRVRWANTSDPRPEFPIIPIAQRRP